MQGRHQWIRVRDERFATPPISKFGDAESLGALLRQRRRELRFTQKEAAEVCGTSRKTLIEMEKGKGSVGMDTWLRYINILNGDMRVSWRDKEVEPWML